MTEAQEAVKKAEEDDKKAEEKIAELGKAADAADKERQRIEKEIEEQETQEN